MSVDEGLPGKGRRLRVSKECTELERVKRDARERGVLVKKRLQVGRGEEDSLYTDSKARGATLSTCCPKEEARGSSHPRRDEGKGGSCVRLSPSGAQGTASSLRGPRKVRLPISLRLISSTPSVVENLDRLFPVVS